MALRLEPLTGRPYDRYHERNQSYQVPVPLSGRLIRLNNGQREDLLSKFQAIMDTLEDTSFHFAYFDFADTPDGFKLIEFQAFPTYSLAVAELASTAILEGLDSLYLNQMDQSLYPLVSLLESILFQDARQVDLLEIDPYKQRSYFAFDALQLHITDIRLANARDC